MNVIIGAQFLAQVQSLNKPKPFFLHAFPCGVAGLLSKAVSDFSSPPDLFASPPPPPAPTTTAAVHSYIITRRKLLQIGNILLCLIFVDKFQRLV